MKSDGKNEKLGFIIKLIITTLIIAAFVLLVYYLMKVTGLKDNISSIEELRDYISSLGGNAVIVMIIFQILQVVILPVPGFVAVGAAVALFGPLYGAIYSLIGILIGSFIAFFIGRKLGFKAVAWLVGEKTLVKTLDRFAGKDRAFLTFAFLFPFFPDDVLCFVSGLTKMSLGYFSVTIIVTRVISVFITAYSVNGNIIPYDTAWGIIVWILIFIATAVITYFVYKKGDKIEEFFKRKRDKN